MRRNCLGRTSDSTPLAYPCQTTRRDLPARLGILGSRSDSSADNISETWMSLALTSCPQLMKDPRSPGCSFGKGGNHYRVRTLNMTTAHIPGCQPVSTSIQHPPLTCKHFILDAFAALLRRLPSQQLPIKTYLGTNQSHTDANILAGYYPHCPLQCSSDAPTLVLQAWVSQGPIHQGYFQHVKGIHYCLTL